jgi:hypothetical protein
MSRRPHTIHAKCLNPRIDKSRLWKPLDSDFRLIFKALWRDNCGGASLYPIPPHFACMPLVPYRKGSNVND